MKKFVAAILSVVVCIACVPINAASDPLSTPTQIAGKITNIHVSSSTVHTGGSTFTAVIPNAVEGSSGGAIVLTVSYGNVSNTSLCTLNDATTVKDPGKNTWYVFGVEPWPTGGYNFCAYILYSLHATEAANAKIAVTLTPAAHNERDIGVLTAQGVGGFDEANEAHCFKVGNLTTCPTSGTGYNSSADLVTTSSGDLLIGMWLWGGSSQPKTGTGFASYDFAGSESEYKIAGAPGKYPILYGGTQPQAWMTLSLALHP